ncbi:hypothetical protein CSV80_15645 [Sporosarcina sp. P12(2017)]|uniref:DUF5320 domain-containing protein n=1 Tax=unclassified Sporosarcina TaxID=2647733 RepID=UPI000C170740|nr:MULTISPECIES: DUF5320 domain-containing protein [unclassified Sporosarcina]PIC56262.1 hypothetical protein CSV81_15225 [Sporosarcina sp. P10]PIC59506.1 hypothetical protein CSV80_15645 [Sporosarcina sp. P12(2017)]
MKDNLEEIERLKEQLEQVKQQDRILEEIEKRLFKMKEIAEYASKYRIDREETRELEKHKVAIQSSRKY